MQQLSPVAAPDLKILLEPIKIRHLTIRNRMVSTAHNSRYGEKGLPAERYQAYTEEKARGGIGLIVIGGGASVAPDSKASAYQLSIYDEAIIPLFKQFSKRVHQHGATLMCQLAHMGRKTKWSTADWLPPVAPSFVRERNHRSFPKVIEEEEIWRIIDDYARSAANCREGGLAGVEIAAHAQQLVDQFLSPASNQRTDQWGGSLENRMRFAREILKAIRKRCGDDFVIGMRLVGDERLKGGLTAEECATIARLLSDEGLIDFLNVTNGQLFNHSNRAQYSPGMWSAMGPYLNVAHAIKQHVKIPVMHAARIHEMNVAARALHDGLVDMVGLTRAYIADPHLGRKIYEGRAADIRPCVGANYCLDRQYLGGEALCIHNASTGREQTVPHHIERAAKPKRVVVVGGGPAGLEAARVCGERGHKVSLIEQHDKLGGKINVASRAPWRSEFLRIVTWQERQLQQLGVDVRKNTQANPDIIDREKPDVVILATGGIPHTGHFDGAELAMTVDEALSKRFPEGARALVYDDQGAAQASSCAEYLADNGARVTLVTPDRSLGEEMGPNNWAIFKNHLYKLGVKIIIDHRLEKLARRDNKLIATIANEYTNEEKPEEFDIVIADYGTRPDDRLYTLLKSRSSNRGIIDQGALISHQPQPERDGDGFALYRVGDALAGRDIHAAVYDSLRLCRVL